MKKVSKATGLCVNTALATLSFPELVVEICCMNSASLVRHTRKVYLILLFSQEILLVFINFLADFIERMIVKIWSMYIPFHNSSGFPSDKNKIMSSQVTV